MLRGAELRGTEGLGTPAVNQRPIGEVVINYH